MENKCKHKSISNFDCKSYINRYDDLKKAFGYDCEKALNHWNVFG